MRVANMKGIICANGNLKKARVTITFDNSKEESSPVGYGKLKELEVTRECTSEKSTYMINSKKVTQDSV